MEEDDQGIGHHALKHQVIQDGTEVGVAEVVGAVVEDEQWEALAGSVSREVEVVGGFVTKGAAFELFYMKLASGSGGVGNRPGRYLITSGGYDGLGSKGTFNLVGILGIQKDFMVTPLGDLN
jgi:hypothetical protein